MSDSPNIKSVKFDEQMIQSRIKEIGKEISKDYKDKELVVIGVCNGALYFMSDLTRQIDFPIVIDTIGFGNIPDKTKKTGVVKITKNINVDIKGKYVILVEDVIRTGLTTAYLVSELEKFKPKDISLCTMLFNPNRLLIPMDIKYRAFEVDDTWLWGYGLDYKEKGRNLPYIVEIEKNI